MAHSNKNFGGLRLASRERPVRHALALFGGLTVMLALGACTATRTELRLEAHSEIIRSADRYQKSYVLRPGDELEVFVYRYPDFSRTGTVRPDGYFTLPLLDNVTAAGLTSTEFDGVITGLLSARLIDPEVTVFVENIQEPMVYVLGEVGGPLAIPVRHARTVAEAIVLAGGIKNSGDANAIAVIRLDTEGYLSATTVEQTNSQPGYMMALQNFPVLADDIILVPEGQRSQFVRAINDYVNTPLQGINQILAPYFQFKLLKQIEKND